MWRNELVCCVPFCLDGMFVGVASFVVKDLEFDLVVVVVDATHHGVVSCDAMDVSS